MVTLSIITAHKGDYGLLAKTTQSVHSIFGKVLGVEHLIIDATPSYKSIPEINCGITKQIESDDSGIFEGMNRGFELCRGRYIMFLNTGDTLNSDIPGTVIIDIFRQSNEAWFQIIPFVELRSGLTTKWKSPTRRKLSWGLRSYCHQAQIIRRDMFECLGGLDSTSLVADWKLSQQLSKLLQPTHLENFSVTCREMEFSNRYSLYDWACSIHKARQELQTSNRLTDFSVFFVQLFLAFLLFLRKKLILRRNFNV